MDPDPGGPKTCGFDTIRCMQEKPSCRHVGAFLNNKMPHFFVYAAVLRIQTHMMRIRIRIRTGSLISLDTDLDPVLLPIKVMQTCDYWSTDLPQFHFEPPLLLLASTASTAPFEPPQLPNCDYYPDPVFDFHADPDPTSQIIRFHADPNPQHC